MGNTKSSPSCDGDGDGDGVEQQSGSVFSQASEIYEAVVNAIIRPPRCEYLLRDLGPVTFRIMTRGFTRTDFELYNSRNHRLCCSHWEPVERKKRPCPCVIYMHGNSSSRIECLPLLSTVLSLGATLFAFDFSGSGQSDGEFVSLGTFEKDDLAEVIEYLRGTGKTSTIALWGRSMGAATSLLHGERDPSIACMVLDSPFSNLVTLAEEIVQRGREKGMYAPTLLVSIALRLIRSSVIKKADFDIREVSPVESASRCFIPALFVAADNDDFIPFHHSQEIHRQYAGDKNIIKVSGTHNSSRPKFMYDSASNFLLSSLRLQDDAIFLDGLNTSGNLPWDSGNSYCDISHSREDDKINTLINKNEVSSDDADDKTSAQQHGCSKDDIGIGMNRKQQVDVENTIFTAFGGLDIHSPTACDELISTWICSVCSLENSTKCFKCNACDSFHS